MRHLVFFVAILVMAACDGATGEGDDLTAVADATTPDSVKGDGPDPLEDTYQNPEDTLEVTDTMQFECNPPFEEGARVLCLEGQVYCNISWNEMCKATCLNPFPPEDWEPWKPGTASVGFIEEYCVLP